MTDDGRHIASLYMQLAARGQEIAKLQLRIYHQRLTIREMKGPLKSRIAQTQIERMDVERQNRILKDQNHKLLIENREMRLLLLTTRKLE